MRHVAKHREPLKSLIQQLRVSTFCTCQLTASCICHVAVRWYFVWLQLDCHIVISRQQQVLDPNSDIVEGQRFRSYKQRRHPQQPSIPDLGLRFSIFKFSYLSTPPSQAPTSPGIPKISHFSIPRVPIHAKRNDFFQDHSFI